MRINQNIAAFNAYRNLNQTQNQLSGSLEKLSSGFRINRAADDAAGLVNSENLRSQIGGLKVAQRNAQDAISMVQTAEGAQTEVHSMLQRMRDLVVQSGNLGANDEAALQANQDEIEQLGAELTRISEQTQFGTKNILAGQRTQVTDGEDPGGGAVDLAAVNTGAGTSLEAFLGAVNTELAKDADVTTGPFAADGTDDISALRNIELRNSDTGETTTAYDVFVGDDGQFDTSATFTVGSGDGAFDQLSAITSGETEFTFQIGANSKQNESVTINGVDAGSLGVADIDVTTADIDDIDAALDSIDGAISNVSENRATLGAFQNRMESTIRNVGVAVENLSAAESRIRDTDMADEMVEFTRNQILQQAGTSMLAQANQVPQSVLSLLG